MATAFSLTGSLRLTPKVVDTLNLTDVTDTTAINWAVSMADGSAADQANRYWKDVVTIAASQTATIDLEDLELNVFTGTGTLNLASQKIALLRNLSATTAVTVALGTSLTAVLAPGGVVYATNPSAAGWAEDDLTITNAGAAAVDVEIHLVGVKAT
jgi:methylthioribose-1-phosphate isomerase